MKRAWLLACLLAAVSCAADDPIDDDPSMPGGGTPGDPSDPGQPMDPADQPQAPTFDPPANCDPAPSVQAVWDHSIISPAIAALGSAYHGAGDAITNPSKEAVFSARFAYGVVLKDLEDETVLGYIERGDCEWQSLGDAITDSSGTATFAIPAELVTEPGAYNVELVVRGDDSRVRGTLWVVDARVDAVIFDVDGTLTTGDSALLEDLLLGNEPEMYASADGVLTQYMEAGYLPIYLSERPVYLDIMTRDWLAAQGLPTAPLLLTHGLLDGVLSVESYKRNALLDLGEDLGLDVQFAYGNATADICAYATAGVGPSATYTIGTHRGEACDGYDATVGILDYIAHLADLPPPAADYQN